MANQFQRRYPTISVHETLNGFLNVDWNQEYIEKYNCPYCKSEKLNGASRQLSSTCKVNLFCISCSKYVSLTCPVPIHIYRYLSDFTCPNPLCTGIGPNKQKGWIYERKGSSSYCKCYFCGISFNPNSQHSRAWINLQNKSPVNPIIFDEDTWDLYQFFDKSHQRHLSFSDIKPDWYKQTVKRYIYFLLKTRVYTSTSQIAGIRVVLAQFGKVLYRLKLRQNSDISRNAVLSFVDDCTKLKNRTLSQKLNLLRRFFDWLELDTNYLIKYRDLPKLSHDVPEWLDETTRKAIRQHLSKIPAPIARHYLIQEYMAARPGDICHLQYNCLIKENSQWYIRFYQQKTKRWHTLPANREIREVIEIQQQWIRQLFGADYAYLFCHFYSIHSKSYPNFPTLKPLPKPPRIVAAINPMVRIIRMLIEKENVLDVNGQKPQFTGKIIRHSRLQEVRTKYGIEAAQLYANHKSSTITFRHYALPTREQIAEVDLPFQKLLLNPDNKFLPWQSLPESLLKNPTAHELDLEIAPRLVVYGHCALNPKTPCPVNLFPKCYGCSSFRPSTGKLPLYERQYKGEQQRLTEAEYAGAELASEEAKATLEAMDKWLPELRRLANG